MTERALVGHSLSVEGWLLIPLVAVVLADQLSKRLALALAPTAVLNPGTIAGRLGLPRFVLLPLLIGVLVLAHLFLEGSLSRVAIGVALGGASSNLGDLLARGGVVDFINVRIWPVFNLADVAIVSGVIVAVAGELS